MKIFCRLTQASDYRTRFAASYPFLPEVIDVLYHRGSFNLSMHPRRTALIVAGDLQPERFQHLLYQSG